MTDQIDPGLVSALNEFALGNRIGLSMTVLPLFEYVITIDLEVATVWRRKFTVPSLLLITTRWNMVLGALLFFWPTPSVKACTITTDLDQVSHLIGFVQTALFSALRVYAIWGRNYFLFSVVLALSLVPVGTNLFASVRTTNFLVGPPFEACGQDLDGVSVTVTKALLYFTRGSLILADVIVIATTWMKTFRQWLTARRLNMPLSVSSCLLADGTSYFIILLVMNILQLATAGNAVVEGPLTSVVSTLPPILVSRFMLNLRALSVPEDQSMSAPCPPPLPRAPHHARPSRLAGNMGESLMFAGNDSDLGDDDELSPFEGPEHLASSLTEPIAGPSAA